MSDAARPGRQVEDGLVDGAYYKVRYEGVWYPARFRAGGPSRPYVWRLLKEDFGLCGTAHLEEVGEHIPMPDDKDPADD